MRKLLPACLYLLVAILLSYSWLFTSVSSPNERSRIYLSVALVDHGTLSVDEPVARFGKIFDLAQRDGRFYSDKAPGSSLLGALPYAGARLFTPAEAFSIADLLLLFRRAMMLPIGLASFYLCRRLLCLYQVRAALVDIMSVGYVLGTTALHYSGAFFGHQIVAVCLLLALFALERSRPVSFSAASKAASPTASSAAGSAGAPILRGRARTFALLVAGLATGFAVLTEYQAAVVAVLLSLFVGVRAVRQRDPAYAGLFLIGALPTLVTFFAYNTIAFGGPFDLSYFHLAYESSRELHNQGLGGLTYPRWEYVQGALFSLHRGLLCTAPVVVLSAVAFLRRPGAVRGDSLCLLSAGCLYYVLMICSSNVWYAGWGFGPRLLVPVLGYLVILAALGAEAVFSRPFSQGIVKGLVLVGFTYNQLLQVTFPELPAAAKNPIPDVVLPMLQQGIVTSNWAQEALGWLGRVSLLPWACCALIVVMLVALRGLGPMTSRQRCVSLAMAALPLILFACAVWAGPRWSEREAHDWMRLVNRFRALTLHSTNPAE